MSQEASRIKLPGFGLPLDQSAFHRDDDPTYRSELQHLSAMLSWIHEPMTIRDRCMLFFINTITDKADWLRKVFDEEIVAKWKLEAMAMDPEDWKKAGIEGGDMTEKMFVNCVHELRDKATLYEKYNMIPVLDVSAAVVKSDSILTNDLTDALRAAVNTLDHNDWHPGSDGKVLDLVHPSLFPLVSGRSRIIPHGVISLEESLQKIGQGETITTKVYSRISRRQNLKTYSKNFQWLPCNVSFPDGENAKIESYINNLHPKEHQDLYKVLEELITQAVPLWNITTQHHGSNMLNQNVYYQDNRVWTSTIESIDPTGSPPPRPTEPDEAEWDDETKEAADEEWREEWIEDNRTAVKPEPEDYKGLCYEGKQFDNQPHVDLDNKFDFLEGKEKKLQVIIKLANIHLTPEKPEYEGGSWHVEGQLNERIVSSALYYWDNENITDSRIHFRTKLDADSLADHLNYQPGDHDIIHAVFGFSTGTAVQELGSVLTREGRVIAFPNGFQHRVSSFRLLDPSKPGHRKIVALFLVDPHNPIISTANVPPQQRHWWVKELPELPALLKRLPPEIINMIEEQVDFPISLDEAKEIREKLMVERGKLDHVVNHEYTSEDFRFCEH